MAEPQRQFLPDEYLIELGKLVQKWTGLDEMLNLMIQKLAGFDDLHDVKSFVLTVHSSFPQRLDIFKSLCEHFQESYPHLRPYRQVASKIKDAQGLRNLYIHSVLGYDDSSGHAHLFRLSARGKIKSELRDFSLDDLKAAVEKTDDAGKSLYRLVLDSDPWANKTT